MSKRIEEIVSDVKYKKLADIGTDHGYISIRCAELYKDIEKIIACDINIEPLNNCKNNIKKYNLGRIIETRIGDGISEIKKDEVETIIIAGMGGGLIIEILKKGIDIIKTTKQLILSPQSNIPMVRKYVHSIGFKITNEKIVYEDSFYYNIIVCENGLEPSYTEYEYYLGKILLDNKNVYLKKFMSDEFNSLTSLKRKITDNAKNLDSLEDKILEINNKLDILKNFLEE